MLHTLYTLKKEYLLKKIYIWNVNRESMDVFLKLMLMEVDICGFVSPDEEYAGESYMNRPVVSCMQISGTRGQCDIVILAADDVPKEAVDVLPSVQVVYLKNALGIREEIQCGDNIVYGIGHGAELLCKMFEQENIGVARFCVTKYEGSRSYRGKDVIEVKSLNQYTDCPVIVSVTTPRYIEEILDDLILFSRQVYIELANIKDGIVEMINFVQNINLAIQEKKNIYLYSRRNMTAELIQTTLGIYGIEIAGYVYETDDKAQNRMSIHELTHEGVKDKLVIINEGMTERFLEARKHIEHAGFTLERKNYTSLKYYTHSEQWMTSKLKGYPDPLCGYSMKYDQGEPGWKLYGKENSDCIRIIVIGNSTSSEISHPENWISKLYHRLVQNNIRAVIYNGAHPCNDIVSGVLRFLRDGYVLRPHILICMSGINNTYHKKCVNQFNEERLIWRMGNMDYYSGVKSDEPPYDFWKRNVKLLKLISEFYGAKSYVFLQPMNITMRYMSLREKSMYESEKRIIGAREFSKFADKEADDIYINLMRLFEHQDDMYFDMCHYTDIGHKVIADKVYEAIEPMVVKLNRSMQK